MGQWNDVARVVPPSMRLALMALVGSHAYGTSTPESDRDYRGVFVMPSRDFFKMSQPTTAFQAKDPDVQVHELVKFAKLAAAGNPTVLETLWAPDFTADLVGFVLREKRGMFLSRRVVKTYGGYALQQLRRGQAGTGGTRGRGQHKRNKAKLHTVRLLDAGTHVLRTGEVLVRHPDPEYLWEMAGRSWTELEAEFLRKDAEMQSAARTSDLPEEPDTDGINDLLVSVRMTGLR